MSGTTAVILTLVGAVVLCGVVVWFVLQRTKRDTYRGTVADKTVSDRTDGDGGTYNVHFCCAGCPEEFAKLSAKDKEAKIAAALKKDAAAQKKG